LADDGFLRRVLGGGGVQGTATVEAGARRDGWAAVGASGRVQLNWSSS